MLDNIKFGVATSAYQIEGGWNQDGKVSSIWDRISHGEDKYFHVKNSHTGDIACNHYNRWEDDIKLMKELGIKTYRFSISWSRICTNKCMCSNLKGIKFYQNLVKKLLEYDIEPFVTLYHWDLPLWLDEIGGWGNKKSIDYFNCYADTMFNALPDVKHWITFNEPAVFVNNFWGHHNKQNAIKNVLLSHAKAVKNYHKNHDGQIGISLNLVPIFPNVYNSKDDIAVDNLDKIHNRIWLDPMYKGMFPEKINNLLQFNLKLTAKEKKQIKADNDFIGVNYYTTAFVEYNQYNKPTFIKNVSSKQAKKDEMGTEIHPFGIREICKKLKEDYDNPDIYITENGCAYPDVFTQDKEIHDYERVYYIRQHLKYLNQAVKEGCKIKGYFYWSFMDNFEWIFGYNKRFGLVYVFYPTQSRVCKDSFHWYRGIITNKEFRDEELGGKL